MNALEVTGLTVRYDGVLALDDVTLTAEAQQITAVVGPLGAGTSSLLRAIAGLVPAVCGAIRLGDDRIDGLSAPRRADLGICYLPPAGGIFPGLSVAENVALMCRDVADRRSVTDAFPELARRWSVRARALSGGEQRLLAATRAVAARTRVVLFDEPFHSLSPSASTRIESLLVALAAERALVVVIADHDERRASRIARKTVALRTGRAAAQTTTRDP